MRLNSDKAIERTRQRYLFSRRIGGGVSVRPLVQNALATLLLLICLSANAATEDTQIYSIDLLGQNVAAALTSLSEQTGVLVLFPYDIAEERKAKPVKGEFTLQQALDILLQGTGLSGGLSDMRVIQISLDEVIARNDEEEDMATAKVPFRKKFTGFLASIFVASGAAAQEPANADATEQALQEIIVVGTQIRGASAAGANFITIDREEIELSGLATTQEILQSVPQNFGGGANEATTTVGVGGGTGNFGYGSSVNLRGLGTDSTLVLLNGRRSASGGGRAGFVDLNSIPTAAIERVEILPDGASAIYGSDAVGGVINVILLDDYDGAETGIRYAPGTSDIDEVRFSQVFGKSWDSGNVLFTYEFYDRDNLESKDRRYTRDSDLTNLGGTNHNVQASNPGNINRYTPAAGGGVNVQLAIPEGQDGTALTPTDLLPGVTNLQNIREGTTVLPEQTRNSVFVSARQESSDSVELFAEARYSAREFEHLADLASSNNVTVPNSNPFFVDLDPMGGAQNLRINYSFGRDYGPPRTFGDVDTISGTLGATVKLSNSWQLGAYGSYNSEETHSIVDRVPNTALLAIALADPDPATAFNPFGDGLHNNPATLTAIEGFRTTDVESALMIFNVLADGELFDLPGGAAKLAFGGQFRNESLVSAETQFSSTLAPVPGMNFDLKRDVTAAFAEIYLPFVTDQNSRPGIRRLAVSIAGRYEDYSDFGDTSDPKFGVAWSLTDSFGLRATAGTSFRAPLLTELDDQNRTLLLLNLPDPASPTGLSNTILIIGNQPGLVPQVGSTWTAGFDVTPAALPSLRVSVTYFDTEVDDLITLPTSNITAPLLQPDIFAPIINKGPDGLGPDPATVTPLLNDPTCLNCGSATADEVDAIVDVRRGNLAKAELSGIDLDIGYVFETDAGSFDIAFYASHLFEFKEQLANGPLVDNVDTIIKPNSLKLRGSVTWNFGKLNAALYGNHIGDYKDTFSSPQRAISSWTTWDLNVGYSFGDQNSGFLDDVRMAFNVRNFFDEDPPFVDNSNGVGFDAINANSLGRFVAIQLTKVW